MSFSSRVQDLYGNPLQLATGEFHTIGEHTLIPAPGINLNIHVVAFHLQKEDSAAAHTIQIRMGSGAANDIWRLRLVDDGDGEALPLPSGQAFRLGANRALMMNLVAASQVGFNIVYYTKRG